MKKGGKREEQGGMEQKMECRGEDWLRQRSGNRVKLPQMR